MTDRITGLALPLPERDAAQSREAIARAAQRTGVDFDYLLAQAQMESGMDPRAQARTSSATGLFQFIDQTWLAVLDRHGERLGLGTFAEAIETSGGQARITDPAMRQAIMQLRLDPAAASLMAGALASDNASALQGVLGRAPDASELYLAHFLGAAGAARFLGELASNPDGSAAALLPRAASANRAIFLHASGAPRSVSEVMAVIRGRVERAMAQGAAGPVEGFGSEFSPMARFAAASGAPFAALPAGAPASAAPAARPSMADALRQSFALGDQSGADLPGQAHVRRAYARLEAFGL